MSDHHDLESPPESARVREALELAREEVVEWGEGRRARSWDEVARELGLQEEIEEEEVRRKELWAIAVAALVLAGAAALSRGQAPAEAPVVETTRIEREAPRDERAADAPEERVVEAPAHELVLLAHRVDGMSEPLFASADARWTYDASGTMTLERGRVLIEYVPEPTPSAFTVVTEDARVRVLGTVFSVERREARTRVAVFEGSVRVDHGEGSRVLGRDQAWRAGDAEVASARADELEEVTHHVDMEAHRARLERVRAQRDAMARAAEREVEREPAPAPSPARPSVGARIERAEAWMARGEYAMARDSLESAAREVPERSARARQIELDLARIATRHLRDDARAVTHLRRVARRWPDHPAAALARAQLCALAACEGGE